MSSSALFDRYAGAMIRSAAAHGFTWSSIATAVRLSQDELSRAQFDKASFCRISREVKLLMGDEFCGFTPAPCPVGTFYAMCARAASAPTVGEALHRAFGVYCERTQDVRFELCRRKNIAHVKMTVARSADPQCDFLYEWWFLIWQRLASWLAREEGPVVAADLPHAASGDSQEYAEAIAGVCRFERPVAQLFLLERHLCKPVLRTVEEIPAFMAPRDEHLLQSGNHHLKLKLKQLLCRHLVTTQTLMSIEDAAAHFHVGSQTLRRRLQVEWTCYRLVKEEVRREAALRWLAHERLSIAEVSLRAGFSEPNGLTRALKAWTGVSPSAYRDDTLT
jgi:AraC-like DNA-binding protein